MSRTKMNQSRYKHSQAAVRGIPYGICVAAALSALLMSSVAFAQQSLPPAAAGFPAGGPPPGGAPPSSPAGNGTTMSSDPKLLAPLPPAPEEALKRNPPSSDPRNLAGVWLAEPMPFPMGDMQLPLTDAAKQHMAERMQRQMAADAQGKVLLSQAGRCRPMEGIGIGSELFPAEIIQTSEKIVVLNEEGRSRWTIRMNSQHPQQVKHSYFGDSVGHWEGDTLVVDTVGLHSSEGAFGRGVRSDQARVVSRLRKTDGGSTLELMSTTHDPQTYTQPFDGGKTVSHWHPELSLLEFQCEENIEGAREGMVE